MITVSKRQLGQVEYLIDQSIQGNHVLFDLEMLRSVFWSDQPNLWSSVVSPEEAYEVEHHIERIILQPTLAQKKAYVEKLDPDTLGRVIKTYFIIVENNLIQTNEVRH